MVIAILVEITPLGENPWMRVFFGVSALNFTLRAAIPLVLGALSGILCERSGIINIGIEGMMLAGAFAGFVAKSSTNDWPLYANMPLEFYFEYGRMRGHWTAEGKQLVLVSANGSKLSYDFRFNKGFLIVSGGDFPEEVYFD